jgi:hypothetical protein
MLLFNPPLMPAIPIEPTQDDGLRALALLYDLLSEFEFIDDVSQAVALSAMITPVVRAAFPLTPMHAADAPMPGAGKSYLFDLVSAIAIGEIMPTMTKGEDEKELEKRLGSLLLAGQPLISIDNVNGDLGGDCLCSVLSQINPKIRILGTSGMPKVNMKGITMFANGNNIRIVGDLSRRVIKSGINAKLEKPERRKFVGNPVRDVLNDCGKYVAAVLTICRAYIVAGQPNLAPSLAGYEGWSDLVRSALMWLGEADPVNSIEVSRADGPIKVVLAQLLMAWADAIGYMPIKLSEVITKANDAIKTEGSGCCLSCERLC